MIVIIDNQDSFTYNLVHYLEQFDSDVAVFQNEQITAQEVKGLSPDLIVLSPGPGRPVQSGATKEILLSLSCDFPILGVCLGHQTIVEHFGGRIIKGKQPMHGKVSLMAHNGKGIFEGIASPANVTRYHSLIADKAAMPDCLQVTAETEDGVVMGVQHKILPVTGIQFHPESILTTDGFQMLKNCYEDARAWKSKQARRMAQ
ncbi:aminodeoxychorismate/anthranilate synthase component II [Planococcus shenhongbingii]|uniref:Aminodeoxychorismate/anthranilate synthase component II n=1 Tax=Planococcus shenhongbingii TaxID=3058398 RepID=A0ABT8NBR4_9BACL|nr:MULTISPECIES: aminodeoxychorismate/anthranilate synthase component II [unclassified Planococcus (in: firmicutes)]MDN7245320.1 aminodeoxychorismate/anthranilate synthase component II [Planococcus sp. N017]WKA58424.1 aminodeoxychorismate/anthranilate synthase component II [Planococcus sp. N016]